MSSEHVLAVIGLALLGTAGLHLVWHDASALVTKIIDWRLELRKKFNKTKKSKKRRR